MTFAGTAARPVTPVRPVTAAQSITVGRPATGEAEQSDESPESQHDDRVRCGQCRAVVTRGALAVARGGSHEHTFRNPAGYSWTIRCFRDATGCTAAGALTADATWFAGYEWCYAHCAACTRHLGWWFVGSGPSFVALIVPRITVGGPGE